MVACNYPEAAKDGLSMSSMSEREARRVLAAAMIAIGRATDPVATLQEREAEIRQAMKILGPNTTLTRLLAKIPQSAEQPAPPAMPDAARVAVVDLFRELGHANAESLEITKFFGGDLEGYSMEVVVGGEKEEVFALPFAGRWVLAPGPVGREDLMAVTQAFRRHFAITMALGLHARGQNDDAIIALRQDIVPIRALWMHEQDPHELADEYSLVFVLHNPTGNRRQFYCAYDPLTGKTEPYDFG